MTQAQPLIPDVVHSNPSGDIPGAITSDADAFYAMKVDMYSEKLTEMFNRDPLLRQHGRIPEATKLRAEFARFVQQRFQGVRIALQSSGLPGTVEQVLDNLHWEFYYAFYRGLMAGWERDLTSGTVTIVEALMGLGKTHQYVQTLIQNPNLSAMIFLPTKALIQEVVQQFQGLDEVHVVVGIDPEAEDEPGNCYKARDIIRLRQAGIQGRRARFCQMCKAGSRCSILASERNLLSKRIVLATHAQYLKYANDPQLAYYQASADSQLRPRDVWIIDEHLITNYLYQVYGPVTLGKMYEVERVLQELGVDVTPISTLLERLRRNGTGHIIPATDPAFHLTQDQWEQWNAVIRERTWTDRRPVNAIREVINAVRNGCAVQRDQGEAQIYAPIISQVNARGLPAQVFFDGTPPPEQLFRLIYGEATAIRHWPEDLQRIVPQPGTLEVFHTNTLDLPKAFLHSRLPAMLAFLRSVVRREQERDIDSKGIRILLVATHYHEELLRQNLGDLWEGLVIVAKGEQPPDQGNYLMIEHYGNLRGLNLAQNCNVGVLLGSYLEPDAVQAARTLPFLPDLTETVGFEALFDENDEGEPARRFLATVRQFRSAEIKQAITRTRHLYHPVRWYIVSRDPVEHFPCIAGPQYRLDEEGIRIFTSRKNGRPSKQDAVFQACETCLAAQEQCTKEDIRARLGSSVSSDRSIRNHIANFARLRQVRKVRGVLHRPNEPGLMAP
jgi:hypothetical protein